MVQSTANAGVAGAGPASGGDYQQQAELRRGEHELESGPVPLSTPRTPAGREEDIAPPPPAEEGPSPFVQEGVPRKALKAAVVTYLLGTKHAFYVDVSGAVI